MTDTVTIARPYAKAAFATALKHKELPQWFSLLQVAAMVVQDKRFAALLQHPRVTREQGCSLLLDICGKLVHERGRRFLQLLSENRRLMALPSIVTLFADYQADYEKTISVNVSSAFPLLDKARDRLAQALEIRFRRKVTLKFFITPSLIGGIVVHAGDIVIDGSVQGKLSRLMETLQK
jgi:F-type H+-transporting ATPase subunit delta